MGMTVTKDRLAAVLKSMSDLVKQDVLVGIPATAPERKEKTPLTNAQIGYIMENGAPEANIPARPFLYPGVKDAQEPIAAQLKAGAVAALDANPSGVERAMNSAGLIAQNSVRAKIQDGPFVPLAAATLKARAARGRKGAQEELDNRAAGNEPSNDTAKPLLDTGQLRNSNTYVIRKK